jgi:hypothetical protein
MCCSSLFTRRHCHRRVFRWTHDVIGPFASINSFLQAMPQITTSVPELVGLPLLSTAASRLVQQLRIGKHHRQRA